MAEFELFSDGTVAATEDEYRRGLSKVLKAEWLADVFTVGNYPLLRAIYNDTAANGTFNVFACDTSPFGVDEIAMRFKYDEAGLSADDADKLRLLLELARVAGQARVINATIGKVYITVPGATKFADAAEAALARGV